MVSKIILSLITLFVASLTGHENFNQITLNINPAEVDSSYLKLEHQSHFYAPNGDIVLLHLAHSPHYRYFQNEIGVGYRKFFTPLGIGANLFYMNMTRPSLLIHQLSPGIELLYKNFQISYNMYLPTSHRRVFRKGDLFHSTISELGVKYSPRNDFNVGLLPFYDHTKGQCGLNSRFAYIYDRFEFALSPYYKHEGSGCVFSFGINFGGMKGKSNQSIHRSNDFAYLIEKRAPKIYVAAPKRIVPITPSAIALPTPPVITLPPIEEDKQIEEEVIEPKKPEAPKLPNWWNFIPFTNYKGEDIAKKEEEKPQGPPAVATNFEHISDFIFIPPWEQIIPRHSYESRSIEAPQHVATMIDDYSKPEQPQANTSIGTFEFIEEYNGQTSVG